MRFHNEGGPSLWSEGPTIEPYTDTISKICVNVAVPSVVYSVFMGLLDWNAAHISSICPTRLLSLCLSLTLCVNPFQSNFSANHILPSSYLLIPTIFLQAQPRDYNAQSPVHIKTHEVPRNRKSTTSALCWSKSVIHEEKCRTGSDSGAGATKTCRTSSDIGAEQENHNVGQGPT